MALPVVGHHSFETALGRCAVAWTEAGICRVLLPGFDARRFRGIAAIAPPDWVAEANAAIQALLQGEPRDLSGVRLDLSAVQPFDRQVYDMALRIPPGQTMTYGEIADRIGAGPAGARSVGQALGRNPCPIVVPCHRVLAAGGRTGGFSAPGGVSTKLRMLAIEGVTIGDGPGLFEHAGVAL